MADTRQKNINWIIHDRPGFDGAQLAVLMDIREELQMLNALFRCPNFMRFPETLAAIRKNTAKPKRKKKKL